MTNIFNFKKILIYLAAFGLGCGTQDLFCIMWDRSLWRMDSLAVVHGLQESQCTGSVGLRGCGIVVPWPGIGPMFPALQRCFSTTGPPGKSLFNFLMLILSWSPQNAIILSLVLSLCHPYLLLITFISLSFSSALWFLQSHFDQD